jgi:allantoicase
LEDLVADSQKFQNLVDLAAERLGGNVVWATDDFFAPKENLLKPGRGEFIPGKYTERGKWMDGWESRRKRTPGHDWCIVRLGLAGVIRGVDVDTNHFLGNAPKSIALEAVKLSGYVPVTRLLEPAVTWAPIIAESPVSPGAQNLFDVTSPQAWTHVRLHIFPDGGVARLRLYGEVRPDWQRLLLESRVLDLAAIEHGGMAVGASDQFFSDRRNLIMPGRSANMGDGWESRRRRGPGHDWVVVQLGRSGTVKRLQLETTHFKGNFPDTCSVEAVRLPAGADALAENVKWRELLSRQPLEADTQHEFSALAELGPVTHLRLTIFPDGGVARLRAFAEPEPESESGR